MLYQQLIVDLVKIIQNYELKFELIFVMLWLRKKVKYFGENMGVNYCDFEEQRRG